MREKIQLMEETKEIKSQTEKSYRLTGRVVGQGLANEFARPLLRLVWRISCLGGHDKGHLELLKWKGYRFLARSARGSIVDTRRVVKNKTKRKRGQQLKEADKGKFNQVNVSGELK